MWKAEHRVAAKRSGLRYPSDMTDAEWALVVPLIPTERTFAWTSRYRRLARDF